MIEGDSKEYEVFEEAIKQLTNPIGATVEIGVRRGMGSKMIIDSFRKHHPNVTLNHLGIDPYGNIEYNPMEAHLNVRLDYTNDMKRDALLDFTKDYPEFHLVCLEDTEFFYRYPNGYPVYDQYKIKKSVSRGQPELYPGSMVLDLANREPCSPIAETWPMIQKIFDSLITKSR
jgi:hypothetical protein